MAQISMRLDDNLKSQAETLFNSLGMNLTTAINIFLSQAVKERGIPFLINEGKKTRSQLELELSSVLWEKIKYSDKRYYDLENDDDVRELLEG